MRLLGQPDHGPDETTAWMLEPGDELVGGARVLEVRRNAAARTVRYSTDQHTAGITVGADRLVKVARRVAR